MAEITSIIAFGASGNIGEAVTAALLNAGIQVTAATRAESKSKFPPAVKTVTVDYSSLESLTSAIKGHQAVISLVNAAVTQSQTLLIDAALAAGVKYFIPSEFGHDSEDQRTKNLSPIFTGKAAIRSHLRSKEAEGLEWTAINTGLFFDWGLPTGIFGVNFQEGKATVWDGGNTKFISTNVTDIGLTVVKLLQDPSARAAAKNRAVFLQSVETTQNDLIAAGEEVTGKKFEITNVDGESIIEEAVPKAAKGDNPSILNIIKSCALSKRGYSQPGEKAVRDTALLLPDQKKVDLKESVKTALASGVPPMLY